MSINQQTISADDGAGESINDITSYLQNFNREIEAGQGDGSAGSTFYTIDTSQVRNLALLFCNGCVDSPC